MNEAFYQRRRAELQASQDQIIARTKAAGRQVLSHDDDKEFRANAELIKDIDSRSA